MLNFAVGPVTSSDIVLKVGSEQVPYFRTSEFSLIMKENERFFLDYLHAPNDMRAVFLTGSGTASMEASIINTLSQNDRAIVIDGGTFGHRFAEILDNYGIAHSDIKLKFGHSITANDLLPFDGKGYTALLVNLHETSTGVLYDLKLISEFAQRNNLFLIVDAISCFLTDPIDISTNFVDIIFTGSQKALGCAPGISLMALSTRAIKRVYDCDNRRYYLDLRTALKDMERGQTPFTPAVSVLLQIHARFKQIENDGGVAAENGRCRKLACYFREKIKRFPFQITSNSLSNAVTPLHPLNVPAYSIFSRLESEYGIWVCPNGGEFKDLIFRVGHMGALTTKDYDTLCEAFASLETRGLL